MIQFRLRLGEFEKQRLQLATVFVRRHGGLLKLQAIDLCLRAASRFVKQRPLWPDRFAAIWMEPILSKRKRCAANALRSIPTVKLRVFRREALVRS